jgi:TM2 domain-containing membrane protein YozV
MKTKFIALAALCFCIVGFSEPAAPIEEPNSEISIQREVSNAESKSSETVGTKPTKQELTKLKKEFKTEVKSAKSELRSASKKARIESSNNSQGGEKSQILAALLAFFIGSLGVHRFYLGYTWQGVVQLLTLGLCGIWSLIDFIRILVGDLKPKGGEYASKI